MSPDVILLWLWAAVLSLPFIGLFVTDGGERRPEAGDAEFRNFGRALVVTFVLCALFWAAVIWLLLRALV